MPTDIAPHTLTQNRVFPYRVTYSSTLLAPGFQAFDSASGGGGSWVAGGTSGWLAIQYGNGNRYILDNYTVVVVSELTRAPKDWTVEGSNDNGVTWTVIDTVSSQTGWTSAVGRNFTCDDRTTGYNEFRINISTNNGDANVKITELFLYADVDTGNSYPINYAPHSMTGNSSPSPYVISASSNQAIFPPWHAFDGSAIGNNRFSADASALPITLQVDLGSGVRVEVHRYVLRSSDVNLATSCPNAWTLQGSVDGSTWITLHTVTGQSGWPSDGQEDFRVFDPSTFPSCRYLKMVITAVNGGSNVVVAELHLHGVDTSGGSGPLSGQAYFAIVT